MITIIGRGHSGTRAISKTLSESGVFMGATLNKSDDLIPPEKLYEACRLAGRRVKYEGGLSWDWSALYKEEPDPEFQALVRDYLSSVLEKPEPRRGWKLPETTLIYPWIIKMFPETKFILWYRDPRDNILGGHLTDNLSDFGVEYSLPLMGESSSERHQRAANVDPAKREGTGEGGSEELLRRAVSWFYQWSLVQSTPAPAHAITVRFEDFVLKQEETLLRLEDFLGFKLARIPVRPERVAVWKTDPRHRDFDFLEAPLKKLGYA